MTVAAEYYQQPRYEVAALVPSDALRVLDVGCAEGILGQHLLERGAAEVVGIEQVAAVARRAETRLTRVLCGDVATVDLPEDLGRFDCIIFADVLEHLADPVAVLRRFLPLLADGGTIVASIPNVRHHAILHMLAEGHWSYQDSGIMDRTHLRFFTLKEIQALFDGLGLDIKGLSANMDPAYEQAKASAEGKPAIDFTCGRVTLRDLAPTEVVELFSIQYLVAASQRRAA
jgi:2-polyprenyl-3-methyl-5-hydroxy-6-metoxy-1,4-benzoquinol methylase